MPASTLAFHSRARSLASADGHERAFAVLYLETIDIISVARFLDQKIQSDSSTNRCESHFFIALTSLAVSVLGMIIFMRYTLRYTMSYTLKPLPENKAKVIP